MPLNLSPQVSFCVLFECRQARLYVIASRAWIALFIFVGQSVALHPALFQTCWKNLRIVFLLTDASLHGLYQLARVTKIYPINSTKPTIKCGERELCRSLGVRIKTERCQRRSRDFEFMSHSVFAETLVLFLAWRIFTTWATVCENIIMRGQRGTIFTETTDAVWKYHWSPGAA